jgi:hypothetical protein
MINKTHGVYELVKEILQTISKPYGENIIEDVCLAIENRPPWHLRYNDLVNELSRDVVNNWIGRYTKDITGMKTVLVVAAKRSKIIKAYTKLRP